MAIIGLVCSDGDDRRRLSLIAGESGHQVHGAARLHDAVEIVRELRPRALLVVDSPDHDASVVVRELRQAAPLLPVVVALKDRDSSRAVALMRAGAAEVVPPPWTRESVRACLSKSLRLQGTVFSFSRPPRANALPAYAAAVAVFFAVCLGYKSVQRAQQQRAVIVQKHWDLPYGHPSAMAFADGRLWVADWYSQSIYQHDPRGAAVRSIAHFPAEMPVALAVGGDSVWSATAGGDILRHAKDAALTPLDRAAAPGTQGLAYDGLYLWTAGGGRLRKRLVDARLSEVASYKYPGLKAAGLVWDGRALWSLDAGNRELLRHDPERADRVLDRVPLPEYSDGRYRPVAAAFDGERFWTIGERQASGSGPARLFRHEVRP